MLGNAFSFLAPSEAAVNSRIERPILLTLDPKATLQLQRAGQKALDEHHRIKMPFIILRVKKVVFLDLPSRSFIIIHAQRLHFRLTKLYQIFTNSPEGKEALCLDFSKSTEKGEGEANPNSLLGGSGSIK
ncbi:unnamed protein product [Rodentolepis nana]|uniref:CRAL-TRIO domain-containing protein n=1 Tax=Rodentolepis nana TaxID=102285 RepID=A0A158QJ35_RODNA|nr:unnamed protein product [Rodentolepis nana]